MISVSVYRVFSPSVNFWHKLKRLYRKKILKAIQEGTELNCLANVHRYRDFFLFCYLHQYVFSGKVIYKDFFPPLQITWNTPIRVFWKSYHHSLSLLHRRWWRFPTGHDFRGSHRRDEGREKGGCFTTWFLQYKFWLHWMSRSIKDIWPSLSDTWIQAIRNLYQCFEEKKKIPQWH